MAFIYCSSCGFKIEYSSAKPNFCSSCGTQMGKAFLPATASKQKKFESNTDINDEEQDGQDMAVAPIGKLKIGKDIIVGSFEPNSFSYEEIKAQQPRGFVSRPIIGNPAKPIGEELRELCKPSKLDIVEGGSSEE